MNTKSKKLTRLGVGEHQQSSAYLSYGVQAKDSFKKIDLEKPSCLQEPSVDISSRAWHLRDAGSSPSTSNPLICTKFPASIH